MLRGLQSITGCAEVTVGPTQQTSYIFGAVLVVFLLCGLVFSKDCNLLEGTREVLLYMLSHIVAYHHSNLFFISPYFKARPKEERIWVAKECEAGLALMKMELA